MARSTPTKAVARAEARKYLAKAEEFVVAAGVDFGEGRYSACGLASVHAGIAAADAVTVHVVSVVSCGRGHHEVVGLLRRSLKGGLPAPNERQLVGLLNSKNEIEYSGEVVSAGRAKVMLDQATRFVAWSRGVTGA
jgi:hypothetical protein